MKFVLTIWLLILTQFFGAQNDFYSRLNSAALELTKQQVTYDPRYFSIPYPNGDVPSDKGVCTDVIIRAYRKLGIDLQKEVHEDMKVYFSVYPKNWGLTNTDTNIDHRRVPNLMVFFSRKGIKLPISQKPEDYLPGEIVCWDLGGGITHIGFVVNVKDPNSDRYKIVHNIGAGQVVEDCLFKFKIIGHYRYSGQNNTCANRSVYGIGAPHRENFMAKEDCLVVGGAACPGSRQGLPLVSRFLPTRE